MNTLLSSKEQRILVINSINAVYPISTQMSDYFYKLLFKNNPEMELAFKGTDAFRHRKFSSTLQSFHNIKYLEKMLPMWHDLAQRHYSYHRRFQQFMPAMLSTLVQTLQAFLGDKWSGDLEEAWHIVGQDITTLMTLSNVEEIERRSFDRPTNLLQERRQGALVRHDSGLLEEIGGAQVVKAVHDRFYKALFKDEWLGKFFLGKHEDILSEKQTAFMINAFGHESDYKGDMPAFVHMHMFITAEQADIREQYLRKAILLQGLSEEIADRWLAVDRIFRPAIVKNKKEDCVLMTMGQFAIESAKPNAYQPNFKFD